MSNDAHYFPFGDHFITNNNINLNLYIMRTALSMRVGKLLQGQLSPNIETQLLELNPNDRVFLSVDSPYYQSLEDYSIEELQNAIDRKRDVLISEVQSVLHFNAVKAGISEHELLRTLQKKLPIEIAK